MAEFLLARPRIADLHEDLTALWHQKRKDKHKPNLARRRRGQQLGDVFPIDAYGAGSKFGDKVLGADVDAWLEANVGLVVSNMYADPEGNFAQLYPLHRRFQRRLFAARPDIIVPVTTGDELAHALEQPGKTAVLQSIEGIYGVDGAKLMNYVDRLWKDGVRSIIPVHNNDSAVGTGHKTNETHGLTRIGRQFVTEAATRGFLLDLSHASEQTADDVLDILEEVDGANPAFISHTGSREFIGGSTRNTPDRIAVRVAKGNKKGSGRIGIMPARWIVEPPHREAKASARSVGNTVDYYMQMLRAKGVDNPETVLCVGTDFDGMGTESIIRGMGSIVEVGPALAAELMGPRRRYTYEQVNAILFQNAVTLFERGLPQS